MRVVVVTHDLGRTGVPMHLLRTLRAARPQGVGVHVVARRGGPLAPAIERVSDTLTVLEPGPRRTAGDALAASLGQLGRDGAATRARRVGWSRRLRRLPTPDVVVVAGAGAGPMLDVVDRGGAPVVVHLHELGLALSRAWPDAGHRAEVLRRARRVLGVSRPVVALAEAEGASRTEVVPGFVDVSHVASVPAGRGRLGRAEGGPAVIGGAGVPGWRKGTDRLEAIAHELVRRRPGTRTVWVGGREGRSGPPEPGPPVEVWPTTPRPWGILAGVDLMVVPSREDPLPLVALEAGLHGRALIASPTGGLPDLLDDGRGVVVDGHLLGWVDRTVDLLDDPAARDAMGQALRTHVLAEHTADVVVPRWWRAVTGTAR